MKKILTILISITITLSVLSSCKPTNSQKVDSDDGSVITIQSETYVEYASSDTTASDNNQNGSSSSESKPLSSNKSPEKNSSKDKTSSDKAVSSEIEISSISSVAAYPEITPTGDDFKEIKPLSRDDYYGWKYLKNKGTQAEQKAYIAFEKAFSQYEKTVTFDFKITADEVHRAYEIYMEDHPEEFFLGKASYSMDSKDNVVDFTVKSDIMALPKDEVIEMKTLVQDKVYNIILQLFPNGVYKSEIETVRAVHDYLINNIKYDTTHASEHSHDMYGALINGVCVCEGYAESFLYIMRLCGIECFMIEGTLSGVNHVWNMIKLENEWYHIDVTSDDPILSDGEQVLRFEYFNLSDDEIQKTHIIEDNLVDVPKATATKYNFFKYYGLEFSFVSDEIFVNSISFSMKNGYNYAYFKFTNNSPRDAINHYRDNLKRITEIVNNNRLGKKIESGSAFSYSQNKSKNILNLEIKYN